VTKACQFAALGSEAMADEQTQPLSDQLEEIRAQLDWVRDYL
jgi:hypothetical protein